MPTTPGCRRQSVSDARDRQLLARTGMSRTTSPLAKAALLVFGIRPDVADMGIREGHDLSTVRGVGEDLLVPGHRGVEDDFARRGADGADGVAGEQTAVLEGEQRFGARPHQRKPSTSCMSYRPGCLRTAQRAARTAPAAKFARLVLR